MPFQYKPQDTTRRRKPFTKRDLEQAISEVQGGASVRKTAIKYAIDRTTLRRYYVRGEATLNTIEEKGSQYKSSQIFDKKEEKQLVNYLLVCSKMHYGLTRKQAMQLAFDYALANNKKIPQSWTNNSSAGKDWFRGFLARNPEISLRTPEATSLSRATSFNKKNVTDFYENLKQVRLKYNFEPQDIYNCDETGCTTVQQCPKVLASKKAKQVGHVTSAERGTLVTVCFAVNAIGNAIPPFFIFPRVKYRADFVIGGPEGSDGDSYVTGWMTAKSFLKFMKHFKKHSHASKDNPVLLILDNHESHVSIEVINYAKSNGITLLTIPPHCSNKLQPLDIAVYSSLKSRYNTALSNWMLSNPGKTVTIYQIPGFINTIMSQAFSQANIKSGFKKSGIHPYNADIFKEEDFMCSAVTDRDISNENDLLPSSLSQCRQAQVVFSNAQQDPPDFLQQSVNDIDQEIPSISQQILNDEVQDPPSSPVLILNDVLLLDSVSVSPTNNQLNPAAQKGMQTTHKVILHAPSSSEPNSLNSSKVFPLSLVNCCLNNLNDTLMAKLNCNLDVSFHQCQENDINYLPNSPTLTQQLDIPQTPDHITKKVTITPEIIRPYPKAAPRKTTRRGRQPGKTKILTKTPEKITDENSFEVYKETTTKTKVQKSSKTKVEKSSKTKTKKNIQKRGKKVDTKKAKRQVLQEKDDDTDCEDDFKADSNKIKEKKQGKSQVKSKKKKTKIEGQKKPKKGKIFKHRKRSHTLARSSDSESEENYDDCIPYADSSDDGDWEGVPELDTRWYCFICGTEELLDMRLCISCKRYVHEECVGLTINDSDNFMCPECD